MRPVAAPLVVAPPDGARIRTRLRLSAGDEAVVRAVGEQLGCLAGGDLAARCRLGAGDDQRADRKRTLTPVSSSRWAGSITRTSNDQWERGSKNLLAERDRLRRAIRVLRARLGVPGGKADGHGRGRVRGSASQAERFAKRCRLQVLEPRLSEVEEQIAAGRVSVCRGGRHLAMLRHALDRDDVALTETQWRGRWRAERLFLTADGEAGKRWGNETIRVPRPAVAGDPLADTLGAPVQHARPRADLPAGMPGGLQLSRRRVGRPGSLRRGRLHHLAGPNTGPLVPGLLVAASGPAAPVASGAAPAPGGGRRPQRRAFGGLGAECGGQPARPAADDPLELEGLQASTRDGRLRAAITEVIGLAVRQGCHAILVEDLDFADARHTGRETSAAAGTASASAGSCLGSRPGSSRTCWWGWPPTPGCGWWRSTRPGPRYGAGATGR